MTSSNDKEDLGEIESPHETITQGQFKVIFQVTKEFHSIPENRLQEAGIPLPYPAEILEFARTIRKSMRTVRVRVSFVSPEPIKRRELWIEGPADIQEPAGFQEFPSEMAQFWQPLISVAVASLGAEELLFRTGYRQDEVGAAASVFGDLFGDLFTH